MKLSCHDQSNRILSITKVRKPNDITNHICLVYTDTEIELSGLIWLGTFCDENHIGKWHYWLYVYVKNKIEFLWPIKLGDISDENQARQ